MTAMIYDTFVKEKAAGMALVTGKERPGCGF
jgi:hypothetical protein